MSVTCPGISPRHAWGKGGSGGGVTYRQGRPLAARGFPGIGAPLLQSQARPLAGCTCARGAARRGGIDGGCPNGLLRPQGPKGRRVKFDFPQATLSCKRCLWGIGSCTGPPCTFACDFDTRSWAMANGIDPLRLLPTDAGGVGKYHPTCHATTCQTLRASDYRH